MNRLNTSMRQQWQEWGYLHLKNVIPPDEVTGYLQVADEVIAQYEANHPWELSSKSAPIIVKQKCTTLSPFL